MKVSVRQREGVTVLDIEGKITIGSGDLELRNAVQQAVNDGAKNLLINLGKVTTLDSSGVPVVRSCSVILSSLVGRLHRGITDMTRHEVLFFH